MLYYIREEVRWTLAIIKDAEHTLSTIPTMPISPHKHICEGDRSEA